MKQALILMAFVLTGLNNFAQTEKPASLSADFVPGSVLTPTNEKLEGFIKSFDNFSVLLDSNGDILIYKHAISTITSTDGSFRLHQ